MIHSTHERPSFTSCSNSSCCLHFGAAGGVARDEWSGANSWTANGGAPEGAAPFDGGVTFSCAVPLLLFLWYHTFTARSVLAFGFCWFRWRDPAWDDFHFTKCSTPVCYLEPTHINRFAWAGSGLLGLPCIIHRLVHLRHNFRTGMR